MDDIEVIIHQPLTNIEVEIQENNTEIEVTINHDGGTDQLRTELGDFTIDLTLNYNIAKL